MRRYEMMVILTDLLEEDEAQATLERIKTVLSDQDGNLLDEAWWGKRRFAYEINKRNHGFYAVLDFEIGNEGLAEVERQLKLSDNVVRFKTVRPDVRVRATA